MFLIKISIFILLLLQSNIAQNICDTPNLSEWPLNSIFKNIQFIGVNIKYTPTNSSELEKCKHDCCIKEDCNYALFKEMKECLLVSCPSEQECQPVENEQKRKQDPKVDLTIRIRPVINILNSISQNTNRKNLVEEQIQQIRKQEQNLDHQQGLDQPVQQQKQDCLPNKMFSPENKCPINQICIIQNQMPVCVCPNELKMVDGVCREMVPFTLGCDLYLRECTTGPNEECVTINQYSKHGTCQCKIGFRRNPKTFYCELEKTFESMENLAMKPNSRRRPSLNYEDNLNVGQINKDSIINSLMKEKNLEPLIQEIYDELSYQTNPLENNEQINTMALPSPTKPSQSQISTAKPLQPTYPPETSTHSSSTIKTTRVTTTTLSTSTTLEPPSIYSGSLKADAGQDIHVYYPSTMCILNGTKTNFFTNDIRQHYITKWEWIKLDSSPAFGEFVMTNEAPIVIYEQLVEGVYRFLLKVYTNQNEISQDVVDVYVHSYLNPNNQETSNEDSTKANFNNIALSQSHANITKNIIQIELAIEPSKFTEILKNEFLNNFELILKQQPEFKLKKPKIILVNTKASNFYKKSTVLLEIIVVEEQEISSEPINLTKNARVYSEKSKIIKLNQNMVRSDELLKLLKRNQKTMSIFDIMILMLTADEPKSMKSRFNNLNLVVDIRKPVCISYENSTKNTCKNGKCDFYSNKCICNKYWMPNLYKFYFTDDLTSGNNCEWNIPLAFILGILSASLVIILLYKLITFVFYYLFCCCCYGKKKDSEKKKRNEKSKKYIRSLKNMDDYDNVDGSNDEAFLNETETSLINESLKQKIMKKSPFKKVAKSIRNVPIVNRKGHKYILLDNDEDETDKKLKGLGRLKYDEDEEDVIYDQNISLTESKNNKNDGMTFKKYNNVI